MILMFFILIIRVLENVELLHRDNQWFMLAYYDFFMNFYIIGFLKTKSSIDIYIFEFIIWHVVWYIIFWKVFFTFSKEMVKLFFILLVDAIEMCLVNNIFVILFLNSKIDLISVESIHYIQLNNINSHMWNSTKIVTHSSCHEG
jgi:hypothetical protein